jgi:hypothetical protein
MRSPFAILLLAALACVFTLAPVQHEVNGQDKKVEEKKVDDKKVEEKKVDDKKVEEKKPDDKKVEEKKADIPTKKVDAPKPPPEEKFDQRKADLETLKAGGLPFDGKKLLQFFEDHTITDEVRAKLGTLIQQFGDDDFDRRESASEEIEKFGIKAIGLVKQAQRSTNPEVLRRCELCLKVIEKVPTRALASAAARLLLELKPEGASQVLLNYLPLAEDDSVSEDVRTTLAGLAMKNGKPDPTLLRALEAKEDLKRGAAAEAFARGGDKELRKQLRAFLAKEPSAESKLRVAVALVAVAKERDVVDDMIKLMVEAPVEQGWRAEEILMRLAGEKGPAVSIGGDKAMRDKARDEWTKWWKANEKTIDLAKLDQIEPTLGYTLIVEMDIRGIGGRVREVTPDGKVRWEITNVQFPTDAIVVANNRVIVAEQNTNKVSERDVVTGKEIWGETFNQPINLHRLATGNIVVVGRHQLVEWDRNRKAVATVTRPQFDIIAGAKLRDGNFAVYTHLGQIITYDKTGKQLDSFNVGRGNYNSTMQVLPNGKLLVTQLRGVAEVDLATKKFEVVMNSAAPTSAQRLANGNILVANQNNFQVAEMEPKSTKTVWSFKVDNNNPFFRPWRAKRR